MRVLLTAAPRFELQKDSHDIDVRAELTSRHPSLAIYQLASILRGGHQLHLLDPSLSDFRSDGGEPITIGDHKSLAGLRFPALERSLAGMDLVGISGTSFDWFLVRLMAERIKEKDPEMPIVAGGVHPTLADEHILKTTAINFLIRGDGEESFPRLLSVLDSDGDLQSIDGLSYRSNLLSADGPEIRRNKDAIPLSAEEIEQMPLPAFDLLPSNIYGKIGVESSRGCKFDCSFCSLLYRRLWRGLSPKSVLKRVEHAMSFAGKLYGEEKAVQFIDGTFTAIARRSERILEGLREMDLGGLSIAFEGRINEIAGSNSNILRICRKLPIDYIFLGVESGYDSGLARIRKGFNTRAVEKCASVSREQGVPLRYGFIVGFPWEGRDECLKTISFADHIVSDYGGLAFINWFYLLPGSRIWEERHSYGITIGMECFDDLAIRTRDYRREISEKLGNGDISEIDQAIDRCNLIRMLIERDGACWEKVSCSGICRAGRLVFSKTGGFVDKTLPFCDDKTALLRIDCNDQKGKAKEG
ncbi:MAG: B12 binding domain protein [Methanosaeta sp. PtaU1.Bin112]|nr:MAG: B12 binding domain protein [Methanosaeta sp. PtaU1.Bin112]